MASGTDRQEDASKLLLLPLLLQRMSLSSALSTRLYCIVQPPLPSSPNSCLPSTIWTIWTIWTIAALSSLSRPLSYASGNGPTRPRSSGFFSPPSFSTQHCSLCLFRPQVLGGEQLIWSSEGWQRAKAATILHPLHFLRANRPPTPIPTIPMIPTRPHVQMSKIHVLFFTPLPLEWWHHTYRYLRFWQYSEEVFFESTEFWPSA